MKGQDKIVYDKFLSGMTSIQRERVKFTLDKKFDYGIKGVISRAEYVFSMQAQGSKLIYYTDGHGGMIYGLTIMPNSTCAEQITKTEAKLAKFIGIPDVDDKSKHKAEIDCQMEKIRKSFGNAGWFFETNGIPPKINWLKRCARTFAYQKKDYEYQVGELEKYLRLKEELKQYS